MTPPTHPEDNKARPPRPATALLRWRCPARQLEEAEGDLAEVFARHLHKRGRWRAGAVYWKEVLLFCLWQIGRQQKHEYEQARGPIMLKNYFKIALRNLRREPGYAFINIVGLAVGLACFLLILLYVQDERGFDGYHEKADRIYRVVETRATAEGGERHLAYTMGPLAETLVRDFPEVTGAVHMLSRNGVGRRTMQYGPNRFYESDYLFTDPAIFEVFDFEWLNGDAQTALNEPNTVVLTEAGARKYFGEEDPVGKILGLEQYGDLRVTGLLRDPSPQSHLQFSMLISLNTIRANERWLEWMLTWRSSGFLTYLVLADGASPETVEAKLLPLLRQYRDEEELTRTPSLQALADIHFRSAHIDAERNHAEGDVAYLYIFSAIALFILLIACINYMNMATARSMRRAREVGMRKVVGAHRRQLVRQFLTESMVTALVALGLSLALMWLILPAFNSLAGKALTFGLLLEGPFLLGLVVLILAVGAAAGSYPALYLSTFRPAQVLMGSGEVGRGASRLRRTLVVTQFALSIIMIVATVVVYEQLGYVQTKRLGFNKDHLVVIDINSGDVRGNWQTIKQELGQVSAVRAVSTSSRVPGEWKNLIRVEVVPEGAPDTDRLTMTFFGIDQDFLDTYEIDLREGRNFSADFADSSAVLLNETAARLLGIDTPAGQPVRIPDMEFEAQVVGIVSDFHFRSLHEQIGPLVLGFWSNPIQAIDYFTTRIAAGGDLPTIIDQLRAVHERFDPSHPFEYNFLDQRLGDFYETEQRVGTLFAIAALLAVLIACLGLFGLASFTAEQRTKEIGVRKVLGASVGSVVVLLSKDFLKLIALAFVVAAPLAYFAMDRWLNDFAYRIEISWPIFLMAGLAALGIALLTVSYQAVRAALANPVESLRYE